MMEFHDDCAENRDHSREAARPLGYFPRFSAPPSSPAGRPKAVMSPRERHRTRYLDFAFRLLTENLKSINSFLWRQLAASGLSPNTCFLSPRCPQRGDSANCGDAVYSELGALKLLGTLTPVLAKHAKHLCIVAILSVRVDD